MQYETCIIVTSGRKDSTGLPLIPLTHITKRLQVLSYFLKREVVDEKKLRKKELFEEMFCSERVHANV